MSGLESSRLTIDLNAYAHNLGVVRSLIPEDCAIMAVVKANAYGLGAERIARRALEAGAKKLAVATVDEGVKLRQAGIGAQIVVLLQPSSDQLYAAIENNLVLTIAETALAERLGELARSARKVAVVHCEIDTGMGRQGFSSEDAVNSLLKLTRVSNLDIEGVLTHFPSADEANDADTLNQIKTFKHLLREMDTQGVPYAMAHAANSAAVVNYPQSALDMVRTGLMTYGVWPAAAATDGKRLRPVVTWTADIVQVREIPGGANIGYGRIHKAPTPFRAAIIAAGYADGYPFALGNVGEAIVRGVRCKIRGRISMDQMVVDISGVQHVTAGDEATLLGTDGKATITIEELAQAANTIPYQILTAIGPRVEREYVS